MPPTYVVITPVRNEEEHLPKTVASMLAQTVLPSLWVIVDDGSTDQTGRIVDALANRYSWVKVVHRTDRGFRKSGAGVIQAFHDGYALLARSSPLTSRSSGGLEAWDFLVKLDGDLSFEPGYFEKCFDEFAANPQLGIAGGTVCVRKTGVNLVETPGDASFHVRGATKIYRRACWEAIGGLVTAAGWDTIDEVKSNMLGWRTETFKRIHLLQHRVTGGAEPRWRDWVKNGYSDYMTGYHPLFMLLKCVKRAIVAPFSSSAPGLVWGFLEGYMTRSPRAADPAVVHYLRQQQLNRLMLRPSLWS